MIYDVAVVGLGGMGSAILAECAVRGVTAIGLEQFQPAHEFGASIGKSRLIRKAYFEDPAYVPLVLRAYELWGELEKDSAESLLTITGLLTVGEEGSDIVEGTLRAARQHDLEIQHLDRNELATRFPTLKILPNESVLFETDGGVLKPEAAVSAQLRRANAAGAETRFEMKLEKWERRGKEFELRLSDGSKTFARKLILSLGPWFKETMGTLGVPIQVQRNVQCWFTPKTPAYAASDFPAFLVQRAGLPAPLYGFPDFADGVKAAFHGWGELTEAQDLEREIDHASDVEPLVRAMEGWMPGAAHTFREAKACMYSLTPDEHFVIDRHPHDADVILCGGFSGHGFKFAPVVGEIAADLALNGGTRHAIDFLSLRRFAQ